MRPAPLNLQCKEDFTWLLSLTIEGCPPLPSSACSTWLVAESADAGLSLFDARQPCLPASGFSELSSFAWFACAAAVMGFSLQLESDEVCTFSFCVFAAAEIKQTHLTGMVKLLSQKRMCSLLSPPHPPKRKKKTLWLNPLSLDTLKKKFKKHQSN